MLDALLAALSDVPSVSETAAKAILKLSEASADAPAFVLPRVLKVAQSPAAPTPTSAIAAASAAADWLTGSASASKVAALRVAADVARAAQRARSSLPADELLGPAISEVERADAAADAEWAAAATDLVVELGKAAPHEASQQLVNRCSAGQLPSPGVLRGLGELAQASPPVMVPLLKSSLLPRLLPLLGSAKADAHRLWLGAPPFCAGDRSHEAARAATRPRAQEPLAHSHRRCKAR